MAKQKKIGLVISAKTNKTINVLVKIRYQHPKYIKTLIKTKRFMVHDKNNICKPGDIVLIEESAPISRRKNWVMKDILNRTIK